METISSLFAGLLTLLVLIIIIYCVYYYRRHKHHLSRFAEELGQDEIVSGRTYQGQLNNVEYYYKYYAGSKNKPSYFKVWTSCNSVGEFKISNESKIDSFFKKTGISIELQTGEEEFDNRFYIQTDSVQFAASYFNSADKRYAVKQLFDQGYNEIYHNGHIMEVKNTPFNTGEIPGIAKFETTVDLLSVLTKNVPCSFPATRFGGRTNWKIIRKAIYAFTILSFISGLCLLFFGLNNYPPLDKSDVFLYSLEYSIPLCVLFTVVSVYLLKGRSSSHKHIMVNFFIAIIGVPLLSFSTVLVYNGWKDNSQVIYHEVRVAGKRISRSKNSNSYYVSFNSWRKERVTEEIKVSVHVFNQVRASESVMIIGTRQGNLNFAWLVNYRKKIANRADHNSLEKNE